MTGTWIFFSLFVLILVTPAVFSDVVGHEPVQVTAGDDVILSCHLEPPFDVTNQTVEWKLNDHIVHLYTDRADKYDAQDEQFRNRTSLFHHEMIKGNISLKLTNVHKNDSGLYICYVPRLNSQVKEGKVLLIVYPQKDPEGGDNETQDDKKPTKDDQTGAIIICVLCIITVSAVMFFYIKRGRREKNNLEDDEERSLCDSSDVVGHEPVQVTAGDDVILSCHLKPPFDVTDLTVEWTRNESIVHLYRHKKDDHNLQDEQFRDRTSLFHHELVKGDISLKLTNVTEEDSGRYICYVRKLNSQVKKGNVLLRVNPQKDPAGSERWRNKQENNQQREQQDAEEMKPLNPPAPSP